MISPQDAAALFAWARQNNLALFPIKPWSKQPTGIVSSHATDWSKEPSRWWEWYHTSKGCNFGVSCGPSNLIVVDVDLGGENKFREWCSEQGLSSELFPNYTVLTPTGGRHYYFVVDKATNSEILRQPNLCGKEVNVRAGHGYVVAPFSATDPSADSGVKASGSYILTNPRLYLAPPPLEAHCAPLNDNAPRIVPTEIVELADDGLPVDRNERHVAAAVAHAALDSLRQAVPGERNEKLNLASFELGKLVARGALAEWRAVDMLLTVGEEVGIPRDEAKAKSTIRSGLKAAPRVGLPEPRSAMRDLLATALPIERVAPLPPRAPPRPDTNVPDEPVVERLLHRGDITFLSGKSGSGKTTFVASLMAASVADARDFKVMGLSNDESDLLLFPCAWVFASYEGGQHIQRTMAAWHAGTGLPALHPERIKILAFDDGTLVSSNSKREAVVNQDHFNRICAAVEEMRSRFPGLNVVLAIDNATSAVENCMDIVQAQRFNQTSRLFSRSDLSVLVLAHPPKGGASDIYGSHLYHSFADTVGVIDVLRVEKGEWVQWIEFTKHRRAMNGECLEVHSRRMLRPLVDLPESWGAGNQKARARELNNLHIPFVSCLRVVHEREKDRVESGVVEVTEVTSKPSQDYHAE